jgi:4-hydroxybenzoate polyprenyltransferase
VVGAALVAALARSAVEPPVLGALIVSSWFPIGAWEVSRKLRAPADETAYETYSKRLGVRGGAALLIGCLTVSLAALFVLGFATDVHQGYLAVASASAGLLLLGALRYAWRPSTNSARLRPLAEVFALVATAGLPVALATAHGVRLEALG